MTKLGWAILTLIVIGIATFASMLSFGSPDRPAIKRPTAGKGTAADDVVVPVAGVERNALVDSFGDPRGPDGTRRHEGTDIIAPLGTPVVAAADGRIEKLFQSDLGGTTIYERSRDGTRIYYYAHLSGYAPGLAEGMGVAGGRTIGFVGDSGDAGPGNYHLHFGIQRMQPGEKWWQGEAVDPYPILAGQRPHG